jgi:hypothetical protein
MQLAASFSADPENPLLIRSRLLDGDWGKHKSTFHTLKMLIIDNKVKFGEKAIHDFKKIVRAKALQVVLPPPSTGAITIKVDESFSEVISHASQMTTIQSAVLIQHCGEGARSLCGVLLRKGAKVDLYVQNPEKCVCQKQRDKLEGVHNEFRSYVDEDMQTGGGQLRIFRFDEPASIRAAMIEGHILEVGWYTYYREERGNGKFEVNLKGHRRPMIVARRDDPAFDELRDHLIEPVWKYLRASYPKPWKSLGASAPQKSHKP